MMSGTRRMLRKQARHCIGPRTNQIPTFLHKAPAQMQLRLSGSQSRVDKELTWAISRRTVVHHGARQFECKAKM